VLAFYDRPLDDLLLEAVAFHGHLCPGQVLGVRMTIAGCRTLGVQAPRLAGRRLVVLVEIDRCAADAIQSLTGVSLGKRTLRHVDYGKMAATFVDPPLGTAVRVAIRDEARELARFLTPHEPDLLRGQTAAYRTLHEAKLLTLERVVVDPAWLTRRRVRVRCAACGEGVRGGREVQVGERALCRGCAGERYYTVIPTDGPAMIDAPTLAPVPAADGCDGDRRTS
jgi:formylmethanofuran dehydrogenase subunit E